MTALPADLSPERADLITLLRRHRGFLLTTVQDLTDDQARLTPTVSELCLGGLIKHVAATEAHWAEFVVSGPQEGGLGDTEFTPEVIEMFRDGFRLLPDETLAGVLADYADVAARTDALVAEVDLDAAQPLPRAPWFSPGEAWTARRAFIHIIAETSQHAGHADILRESIDGHKTMG